MTDTKDRMVVHLKVGDLQPADDNPRRDLGDLDGLAASMAGLGVLEPLLVVPEPGQPGRWRLVAGHRRLAAAKLAGMATVPCIVREDLDDQARREAMLIENLQRRDLDPLEEARGYQLLVTSHRLSQRKIAEKVGVTQPQVSKRLKLLTLPQAAHDMLADGRLTIEEAVDLARCDDPAALIAGADTTVPRGHYMSVQWLVSRELDDKQAAAKRAKRVAAIEADGLRVHDGPAGWPQDSVGDASKTVRLHNLERYRQLDPDGHPDEPCHALVVADHTEYPVCTDPSRHPLVDTGRRQEELELERQEARQRREAADRQRHDTVARIFAGLLGTGDVEPTWVLDLLCAAIVNNANMTFGNQHRIGQLLGHEWESRWGIQANEVADHATQGREQLLAAAIATVLVDLDPHHPLSRLNPAQRAFYELLIAHGYEPTDAERQLLAGDTEADAA